MHRRPLARILKLSFLMEWSTFRVQPVSILKQVSFLEGIEQQTEQAIKNIEAILKAAGTDFSKVVKTTCFLQDMADFSVFNGIYEKAFISKPARSCVAVKELPAHFLCEIEVIAEV